MKAIVQDRYGSADVLQLRDIDMPAFSDDEVLVKVHAAGVDPGVWHLMTGLPYLTRVMGFGLRRPKDPVRGRDVAGIVEAVGHNVSEFRPGDEVFGVCEGSFAEYACARPDRLVHKPSSLTFEQAAAAPISGLTALQALRSVRQGQTVLVIGAAGGVGTYAIQRALALGAHVTGVCSTSKLDLVRSLGADEVIDYTREDFTESGRRYDLILDMAGNRPLSRLRRALTRNGRLLIVGGEGGGRWLGPIDRLPKALLLSPFVSQKLGVLMSTENKKDLLELRSMLESGTLAPVIDRTFALCDAAEAIRHIEAGKARGKVVITVESTR